MLDLELGGGAVVFIPMITIAVVFPDLFSADPPNLFIASAIQTMVWIPVEALLITLTGTTPGKWLFTIRAVAEDGAKLAFPAALKRSLLVWVFGMGIGIPFVNLIACYASYRRLKMSGTTRWDVAADAVVLHSSWSEAIRAVVVVATLGLYLFRSIVMVQQFEQIF